MIVAENRYQAEDALEHIDPSPINPLGVTVRALPLTPSRVLALIREAGR